MKYNEPLPPKVDAIYSAVRSLVGNGVDVNQVKVSEIAQAAGIGKGTVYEYFDSKEDILVNALIFDTFTLINKLHHDLLQTTSFQEQISYILDWISSYITRDPFLHHIFVASSCGSDLMMQIKRQFIENELDIAFFQNLLQYITDCGIKDGVITKQFDTDYEKYNPLLSQMIAYIVYLFHPNFYPGTTPQQAHDVAYQNIMALYQE